MDFTTSAEDEAFRTRLARFLSENPPGPRPRDPADRLAWQRDWAARLADAGYAAPAWPKQYGGMDLPLSQQVVYHEEMARARGPKHPSPGSFVVGPTIIKHGTDEQRERFLRPALRGAELWAQGFSEPEAGSDLPALRTRAVRRGDVYVVTGQKIWVTDATRADRMFTLVRTGTLESRQHGISYLLIDMHAPGVEVRPLRDMTGGAAFTEIFLHEVEVPVADRVGAEDGGWKIARTSMGHERSTAFVAQAMRYRRIVDELMELARKTGHDGDPVVRQRLARAETELTLIRLNGMRVLSRVLRGEEPGPAASIGRLLYTEFEQRLHDLALDLHGAAGLVGPGDPQAIERGRWVVGYLATRASTIGAGTAEIQRNTIAEQVLGLPREKS